MLQVTAILALIFGCFGLSSTTCANFPILLDGETSGPSSSSECPSLEQRELTLEELNRKLDSIISEHPLIQRLSSPQECPGLGWIKAVDFDLVANPDDSCPGVWEKYSSPPHCRHSSSETITCESVSFSTNRTGYSQVCGRVRGYQYGRTDGFLPYSSSETTRPTLDDAYLYGVVITHGPPPRTHIWSFVSGLTSTLQSTEEFCDQCVCPCINANVTVPDYLNGNFYCNSGTTEIAGQATLYDNNPLWDGEGCEPGNECCASAQSRHRFFASDLGADTADNLEVRLCSPNTSPDLVNVGIDQIEIYIK